MDINSFAVELGKKVVPDSIKSFRQEIRLRHAGKIFGLSTEFPIPIARQNQSAVYIVGGGASVLDFDFSSDEVAKGVKIAMGPAIFLNQHFDFFCVETSDQVDYMRLVGDRIKEVVESVDTKFILRIPHILDQMRSQPPVFQELFERSHLMASISLLGPTQMGHQLDRYFSSKVCSTKPGLDPNFTLGRMVIRLIKLGYKEIRLVGVDLLTPEYFYHSASEYFDLRAASPTSGEGFHSTANPKRKWPAPVFLTALTSLEDRYGFQMRVDKASPLSKLMVSFN